MMSVFLYYAFNHVHDYAPHALSSLQHYDWGTPLLELVMIIVLLCMCSLVIIGIKSRWVALLLAIIMALSACWMHPFWMYTFSNKHYRMEGVSHMEAQEVADGGTGPEAVPAKRHFLERGVIIIARHNAMRPWWPQPQWRRECRQA